VDRDAIILPCTAFSFDKSSIGKSVHLPMPSQIDGMRSSQSAKLTNRTTLQYATGI